MNAHEYEIMCQVEDKHWWYTGMHRLIFSILTRLHQAQGQPPWLILDAGCGTGAIAQGLKQFGQVSALDFSNLALQFSKRRDLAGQLVQGSVTALPIPSNSFDLIVSIDVIYMVPEEELALAEFYRVLKPGGILLLNLPALKWLKGEHDLAVGSLRRYVPQELRPQLAEQGFSIERMSFANSLLFPLVAPYRVLTNWLPKSSEGPQSDLFIPPPPINHALSWIMGLESHLIPHVSLPIGMSLFIVAKKGREEG